MTRPTLDPREPVPADIYATEPGAIDPLVALLSARAVAATKDEPVWVVKIRDWVPA